MATAFAFLSNAGAEMYKWVDEYGEVHYTQSKPVGQSAEVIKPPPKVDSEAALKKLEEQKKQASSLREERLEKAKKQEESEEKESERAAQCEEARKELGELLRAQRVFTTDAKGEQVQVGEEERLAAIGQAQQKIAEICN